MNTIGKKESAGGRVVELATIVALDIADGSGELSFNISKKMRQGGKGVGFKTKREGPNKVGAII